MELFGRVLKHQPFLRHSKLLHLCLWNQTNNNWYFFDPYRNGYPDGITDRIKKGDVRLFNRVEK